MGVFEKCFLCILLLLISNGKRNNSRGRQRVRWSAEVARREGSVISALGLGSTQNSMTEQREAESRSLCSGRTRVPAQTLKDHWEGKVGYVQRLCRVRPKGQGTWWSGIHSTNIAECGIGCPHPYGYRSHGGNQGGGQTRGKALARTYDDDALFREMELPRPSLQDSVIQFIYLIQSY